MIDHEDRHVVTVPRWAMYECKGDPRDAMVLAQITWWFQPSQRDGSPRTSHTVERDGHLWMHVTDAELAEDLGMSDNQVRKARYALRALGLIECKSAKVGGSKVTLVRPVNTGSGTAAESTEAAAEVPDLLSGQMADPHAGAAPLLKHGEKIDPPCSPPAEAVASVDPFDEFYAAYPKRKDPDAARRAWARAIKRADPEVIIEGARRYAEERRGEDPTFTKYPATWLNAGAWANTADPRGPRVSRSTTSLSEWAARHRGESGPGLPALGGGR